VSVDVYPPRARASPSTVVGYTPLTSGGPIAFSTTADLPGATVTVFTRPGRRYRLSGRAYVEGGVASVFMELAEGATRLHFDQRTINSGVAGGGNVILAPEVYLEPTPGVHTYKLRIGSSVGSCNWYAGPTYPTFIVVEDVTGGTGGTGPILLNKVENFASAFDVNSATPTDVPGSALLVDVPVGRTVRLRAKMHLSTPSGATNQRARVYIQEGSTLLNGAYAFLSGGQYGQDLYVEAFVTPSPGPHTYKLTLSRDAGSAAVRVYSGADSMTMFVAEDVTGSPAPGYVDDSGWVNVSTLGFQNGWADYSGGSYLAQYRKRDNLVMLRGLIKNGTINTTAFTLPVGFRPVGANLLQHIFPCVSVDTFGSIRVETDGDVIMKTGSVTWMALDGVSFWAD